ncbi:hypothetical protein TNCT_307211 [Trichonephila clavata]|uniref:Uncharacterized protein n=1 Tax=Trichonephila clavata TaxID=2740835 RepID=A0A8X6LQ00_TRICU|nr:hypothetical protein TNCT_307211 [Trichonephila clavata]
MLLEVVNMFIKWVYNDSIRLEAEGNVYLCQNYQAVILLALAENERDLIGETSAAYFCQEFQGYFAVGAPLSNYDGEVASIHSAASQLENCNNPAKAGFLVDSQAAIRNLSLKQIVRELLTA